MGVVVGFLLGAGLFCVWWSFWTPGPRRERRSDGWTARTQDLLVQAGAPSVTPGALVATSVGLGLVVLLVATVLAGSVTIATCFGAIAASVPALVVRSRARRRRARLRDVWPEVLDHLASGVGRGSARRAPAPTRRSHRSRWRS